MKKEREITIKVIENKKINYSILANYFAKKYSERNTDKNRKKKDI